VDAGLAARLGRPDIATLAASQVPQDPFTGYYAADTGGVAVSAGIDTGRLSAGLLLLLALGLTGFYVWTRGSQR
jgi:hypothetical protein